LFLFDVDIWGSIWQVARVNVAVLFFYGWLWFIDLYLNNYSAAAVEEKRRLAKEGVYHTGPAVFEKKVKPEPQPKPVYKKPEPVYQEPAPVIKPEPTPVVQPKPEPVVDTLPKEAPVVMETPKWNDNKEEVDNLVTGVISVEPTTDTITSTEAVVIPTTEARSNREQLMAWIEEEENKEGDL